ncbi:transmembrane protein 42-like [Corythoichthys intestinalis]|uniref:transmembrane protein 42-like n=1 Tax=Corythoichthys intestinalis TaxID=161448 RepID=UPI0025A5C3A8|nr:transmembrane protein 42-like [Corythoichthys intestinalis]XP_061788935.1 transmembrane protein 42-like [Nerophis lumbriciformis]
MISGSFYAFLAGCLGAAASLSAKLTLGADYLMEICQATVSGTSGAQHDGPTVCSWLHIPLRLMCMGLMFLCNAVMWTFFSKALRYSSSSAMATATTSAGNFIFSAILGKLIFGESQAGLYWLGIFLTLCGMVVLHGSRPKEDLPQEEGKTD